MEEDLSIIEDTYDNEQDMVTQIEMKYLSKDALSNIKEDHVYYKYNKEGKMTERTIILSFNDDSTMELNVKR